ncbi:hypothetical protein [Actinokineospora enzanensis]|uniref:hypothetical protein n=1 Tax=Actinokineospora enzanensis TaxID=155975 RepID=UPI00035F6F81|nr:hypothetical protein [Actinokineospora enzanensis]
MTEGNDAGEDGLDVGRGVSAWWLRAGAGAAAAGILIDLLTHHASLFLLLTAALLSLACVLLPASPAPLVLIGLAALVITIDGGSPFRPGVLVLIPLTHLLHLSCSLAGLLPDGARLDPRAVRPTLRRAAIVQVITFTIVGIAALVPLGRTPEPVELIALLSIAGLALAVIVLDRSR